MKKLLVVFLCLSILCGCNKKEDKFQDFKHFSLQDKYVFSYSYHGPSNQIDEYAIADITPKKSEDNYTGLFYKIADNDYILIQEMNACHDIGTEGKEYNYFADNKLYLVRCWSTYVAELNKEKTTIKPLNLDFSKFNNDGDKIHIINIVKTIDNYIYYNAMFDNSNEIIKCNLSNYICELT